MSVELSPYVTLDSQFQYPSFVAGQLPYTSMYSYGYCNSSHFVEYHIIGGLVFGYNVNILNGKVNKSDSFLLGERDIVSGCFLSQKSTIFTLSFALSKALAELPEEAVFKALLVKDFISSISYATVFQFVKIDLNVGNYVTVTLYLGDDNDYSSEELYKAVTASIQDTNSLLYSSDRYFSKYIIQEVYSGATVSYAYWLCIILSLCMIL